MPPLVFAAAAVVGYAAGYVSFFSALAAVANVAIGYLNKPKSPGTSPLAALTARTQTVRSGIASRKIILGECMVGGPMVYAGSSGTDNEYAHIIVPLAGHECESIGTVYFGDKPSTEYNSAFYRINKHLGSADQAADADLVAEVAEWTTNHRLRGCAYLYIRFKYDREVWPNGLPNIKAVVKGAKIFDPRTGLTAWTDNWALCMRYYLRDCLLGLRCDADEIDEVEAAASANISDELVVTPPGIYQARYTCNGVIDTDLRPREIIDSMKSAGAGDVVHSQGVYKIMAGAYRAPEPDNDINETHLRGEVKIRLQPPKSDVFNTVRGLYVSPLNFYEATDFPIVKSQDYIDQDNGEVIVKDIVLDYTDDPIMAQRIAQIELRKARGAIMLEWPGNFSLLNRSPQDTVRVSLSSMGWVNKEFVILDRTLAAEGGVDLVLQSTSSSIWSWQGTDAVAVVQAPDTSLVSALNCPPPSNVLFTEDAYALEGGGQLTWTASPSAFVDEYRVRYRLLDAATYTDFPGTVRDTKATIRFLLPGTYQFQVQGINSIGKPSSWAENNGTVSRAPVIERVSGLELFGQGNDTTFTGKHIKATWRPSSLTTSYDLGDEPYGADSGVNDLFFRDYEVRVLDQAGKLLRTEHVLDNFYTYTFEKNVEDYLRLHAAMGANRTVTLEVYQRGRQNQLSDKPARITVTNPAPGIPLGISTRASFKTIFAAYTKPSDNDWLGVRVWIGTAPGFAKDATTLVYTGPDTTVVLDALTDGTQLVAGSTYYVALQAYDAFDFSGSASIELEVTMEQVGDSEIKELVLDKVLSGQFVGKDFLVGTNGQIRSGQTGWNTGTGWWQGHAGGFAKQSVGSPMGNGWDWSEETGVLNYRGSVTFNSPANVRSQLNVADGADHTATIIDGGIVTTGSLRTSYGGVVDAGITAYGGADTDVRIWAGATYENRANATFLVQKNGEVKIRSAVTGERLELSNRSIRTYDPGGACRIKFGYLL